MGAKPPPPRRKEACTTTPPSTPRRAARNALANGGLTDPPQRPASTGRSVDGVLLRHGDIVSLPSCRHQPHEQTLAHHAVVSVIMADDEYRVSGVSNYEKVRLPHSTRAACLTPTRLDPSWCLRCHPHSPMLHAQPHAVLPESKREIAILLARQELYVCTIYTVSGACGGLSGRERCLWRHSLYARAHSLDDPA